MKVAIFFYFIHLARIFFTGVKDRLIDVEFTNLESFLITFAPLILAIESIFLDMENKIKRTNNQLVLFLLFFVVVTTKMNSQTTNSTSAILRDATLPQVIEYALENHPSYKKVLLDEQILKSGIRVNLSDWMPQATFTGALQHNLKLQQMVVGGNIITMGLNNTSNFQFMATQQILNRDVITSSITAKPIKQQASQLVESTKIDLIVNVTKAYFDLLAVTQQIDVSKEVIVRLERSLQDATSLYETGVTDKIDYKRATIALNNAKASLKSNEELLKAKEAALRFAIGYAPNEPITIKTDMEQIEKELQTDTSKNFNFADRVEYRLLESNRTIQKGNLKYASLAYMPSIYGSAVYNFNYMNNQFRDLYNASYPNAYVALNVSFPLFTGMKRVEGIRQQKWKLNQLEYDMKNFENVANSEYFTALAMYKSQLFSYQALKENLVLAQEVYDIIDLQYKEGVKTYLELITAETDLRTATINFYNSLYLIMSAKIELEKAAGKIQ